MPLTIELSTAIASNRESWRLDDDTTYGGSNPARADCLVFVKSFKMNYDNEETELTVTGNNSDPATDTSWTITYTVDGWYKTYFVIIDEEYDAEDTYEQYDAVHDGEGNVYRSKVGSNTGNALSDTDYWEPIDSDSVADLANNKDTATESANIVSTIYQSVFAADGQYEYGTFLSNQNPREQNDNPDVMRDYNIWAKMLDEIAIAHSRSEVLEGELIARRMQSQFIDE